MNVLGIFFISFLSMGVKSEVCPSLYQRYNKHHTYCLPPKATCKILRSKVKTSEREIILREHNMYRSRIATGEEETYDMPRASNMLRMVWDEELAAVAQKHAEQCEFQHDCNDCRRVENFDVGQNLYERTVYPDPLKPNWTAATKSWYDEVKDFDKAQIDSFQEGEGPPPTGHFTQVIWARTWRVGCGYALYKNDNKYVDLYVCNYGPAGNVKDESIYERGDPCTGCPINSCCGKSCPTETFPGLCKTHGNEAPQYKVSHGSIFFCSFKDEPDCDGETTSGEDRWEIVETLSGNYISIVLNGGESSTLNFTRPFKGKKAMCLTISYRKGPQVAGQEGSNDAKLIIRIPEVSFTFSPKLHSNSVDWIQLGLTLNWNMESMFSMSCRVPPGKPSQYFEMKDIEVKEGKC